MCYQAVQPWLYRILYHGVSSPAFSCLYIRAPKSDVLTIVTHKPDQKKKRLLGAFLDVPPTLLPLSFITSLLLIYLPLPSRAAPSP